MKKVNWNYLVFLIGCFAFLGFYSCTTQPVTTNPSAPVTPVAPPAPVVAPSCASGTWCYDAYVESLITPAMLKASFPICSSYATITDAQKRVVWASLFRAISYAESNWSPSEVYVESDGNPSVGLLQVSFTDAADNGCSFQTAADVKDPLKNLACGVVIANKWVGRDGVVSGSNSAGWLGMSRYWSTMRASNSRYSVTMSKFVCP